MSDDQPLEIELVGGPDDGRLWQARQPLRYILFAGEPIPGRPDWNPDWEPLVYFDEVDDKFYPVTMGTPRFVVEAANLYHAWKERMLDRRAPTYRARGDMRHYDYIGKFTERELRERGQDLSGPNLPEPPADFGPLDPL